MLVESRWRVRSVSAKKCDLNFVAQGYGNGEFVWAGVEPGRHIVAVSREGQLLWRQAAEVVLNRRLTISIPISALDPVDIGVRCMPPESTNEN